MVLTVSSPPREAPGKRVALAASHTCPIDARGDVWLCTESHPASSSSSSFSPGPRDFLVCSRTLARHSKVFDAILYQTRAATTDVNSQRNPSWAVNLPDDDPAPLRWLLLIMHGQYNPPPQSYGEMGESSTTLSERYNLVVLADKYACLRLLQPWARLWAADLDKLDNSVSSSPRDLYRVACLAYHLGNVTAYMKAVETLVVDFLADDQDLQQAMASASLSEGLEARIDEERLLHTSLVLDAVQGCLDDLMATAPAPASYSGTAPHCRATTSCSPAGITPDERQVCHARLLGTMIQTLHSYGMWPLPAAEELSEYSLKDIEDLVAALTTPPPAQDRRAVVTQAHVSCAVALATAVDDSIGKQPGAAKLGAPSSAAAAAKSLKYKYQLSAGERAYLAAQAMLFGNGDVIESQPIYIGSGISLAHRGKGFGA